MGMGIYSAMKNVTTTKVTLVFSLLLLSITSPIGQAKLGGYDPPARNLGKIPSLRRFPIHDEISRVPREHRRLIFFSRRRVPREPRHIPVELPALIQITHHSKAKDHLLYPPTVRVFWDSILTVDHNLTTSPVSPFDQDHSYPEIIPENKVHQFLHNIPAKPASCPHQGSACATAQLPSRRSPYYLSVGDVKGWTMNVNYAQWAANGQFIYKENRMRIFEKNHDDLPKELQRANYYHTCDHKINPKMNVTEREPCCFMLNEAKTYYFPRRTDHCPRGLRVVIDVQGNYMNTPPPLPLQFEYSSANTSILNVIFTLILTLILWAGIFH